MKMKPNTPTTPNTKHTPLFQHMQSAHFWLDAFLLGFIWWGVFQIDPELMFQGWFPVAAALKLLGLLGILEFLSFFAVHTLGAKRGLLVQGFIGGFVSSTAIFVQLTGEKMRHKISPERLSRALLLAVCAMQIESLMILFALLPSKFLVFGWPVMLSLLIIALTVLLLPKNPRQLTQATLIERELIHPISWYRVIQFSLVIIGLIWLIRFLNQTLHLPMLISTFFLALFEAHAVLGAILLNFNTSLAVTSPSDVWLIIMIIFGHTVSKSAILLRTGNHRLYKYVLIPLLISALVTALVASLI